MVNVHFQDWLNDSTITSHDEWGGGDSTLSFTRKLHVFICLRGPLKNYVTPEVVTKMPRKKRCLDITHNLSASLSVFLMRLEPVIML